MWYSLNDIVYCLCPAFCICSAYALYIAIMSPWSSFKSSTCSIQRLLRYITLLMQYCLTHSQELPPHFANNSQNKTSQTSAEKRWNTSPSLKSMNRCTIAHKSNWVARVPSEQQLHNVCKLKHMILSARCNPNISYLALYFGFGYFSPNIRTLIK